MQYKLLEHRIMVQMLRQTVGLTEQQYDHGGKGARAGTAQLREMDTTGNSSDDDDDQPPADSSGTGDSTAAEDSGGHQKGAGKLRSDATAERWSSDATAERWSSDTTDYRWSAPPQPSDRRAHPYGHTNIYVSGGGSSSTWMPPTPRGVPPRSWVPSTPHCS